MLATPDSGRDEATGAAHDHPRAADRPPKLSKRDQLIAATTILVAVAAHLVLQAGMMWSTPGWGVGTFRNYFYGDQMSYLAIVSDWSRGVTGAVEPFTATGSIYYPRLYYQALGLTSRVTGLSATTVWTLSGLAVQSLLVAMISLSAVLLSRRPWAGLLGFLPFVVGVMANLRAGGGNAWSVKEGSHAEIWGIYASMFTLNGDAAALSLATIALLTLVLVASRRTRGRWAVALGLGACTAIGALSAVQTYSFLSASYIAAYGAAVYGMHRATRRAVPVVVTIVLAVLLFVAGPQVATRTGALVLLMLGLVPAIPGLLLLWRQIGRWAPFALLGYSLGAIPQTFATLMGLWSGDPFLKFRTVPSNPLGVPAADGLVSALPVLVPLVWVLLAGLRQRRSIWVATSLGGIGAWFLGSANDVWGANQEPYRLWLNGFGMMAGLALPLVVWVATHYLGGTATNPDDPDRLLDLPAEPPPAPVSDRSPPGPRPVSRMVVAGALATVGAVAVLSLPDFVRWRQFATSSGYIPLDTERWQAAASASMPAFDDSGRLVLAGPCVDVILLHAVHPGPVAFFNKGLAWPDHPDEIRDLSGIVSVGELDQQKALSAGVGWLLTDTACAQQMLVPLATDQLVTTVGYTDSGVAGSMQLWRLV